MAALRAGVSVFVSDCISEWVCACAFRWLCALQLKDGLKQMKVKGKAWAKNFAVVGGKQCNLLCFCSPCFCCC